MGYEIKMLVGKSCLKRKELELDKQHPFEDGSGFPYKKNAKGEHIETGREESWFQIYAEIDLCKLGYQDDALNRLVSSSQDKARSAKEVFYFFGTDGNTKFTEDRYGSPMFPVPIKEALAAMKKSLVPSNPYRRLVWAIALLSAMVGDSEELEVMFYGH